MRARFSREFFIPSGSERCADSESDAVVYMYNDKSLRPSAVAFHGRAQKPDWHHYFSDEETRSRRIQSFFESRRLHLKNREEHKEKQKALHDFKCGDVLCSTWGWEQTNVDFFQVVRIVSDRTIELREIYADCKDREQWMTGTATPAIDSFKSESFQRRVTFGRVTIDNVRSASRWNGKPVNWTAYA